MPNMDDVSPAIAAVGDRCCGCGACAAVCPVSCLEMSPDSCGFVRPSYETGCIGCGRCAKACPVLAVGETDSTDNVFWAKGRDDNLRNRSSSGGVFGALAEKAFSVGGVVYGATFTDNCEAVKHVRVNGSGDLDRIMRSKYVQSSVGTVIYKGVAQDLRDGRRVVFSGTACQNAAMRNYLDSTKVPTDNLLLVEVICHGVPSPRLWAEWLEYVSREAGSKVDEVNFRSKSTGWVTYSVAYYVATEKVRTAPNTHDWYMKAFLQNASLRQSCLACPAKRCCGSDITLGDFWGVQGVHPEVVDDLGVSAVICNTERGVAAFEGLKDELLFGRSSMDEVVPGNPALVGSVAPHPKRVEFLSDVGGGMGIGQLMEKWSFEPTLGQRVRGKLSGLKHRLLGEGR